MTDELSKRYGGLLTGAYDCVDRIVLNAYFSLGHNPGGFRVWWRRLHAGSEEHLDNTHLMRMAGRFSRRVRAFAKAHNIPVIDCGRGERKHQIAEDYLATHTVGVGVFLILVARAAATVWEVKRSASGVIADIAKKTAYVNHYSLHIMDPDWGHLMVKLSGHPPFGTQVIANGHEWVALKAQTAGIGFHKEGNCFTAVADPQALAQVAAALSQPATIGRLRQVCDRWISSACLCFGLDADEQARSGFRYEYSVYQAEATDPSRAGGGPGAFGRTRRLHRRRPGRQGPADGRPDRLHHPPGGLDLLLDGIGRLACRAAHRPGRVARPPPLAPGSAAASARTARNPESSPR